jgi:hypothetical protein
MNKINHRRHSTVPALIDAPMVAAIPVNPLYFSMPVGDAIEVPHNVGFRLPTRA